MANVNARLLIIAFLACTVNAQSQTTRDVILPKCSDYPNGYFVTDFSNCQGYFLCPNASSEPIPGKCAEPFNFDQTHQMCNYQNEYSCLLDEDALKADYTQVSQPISKTSHFTQVVWKSSTRIGVGIATKNRRTVICINYEPRGNVEGQFPQNVLPPKKVTDPDFMLDSSN